MNWWRIGGYVFLASLIEGVGTVVLSLNGVPEPQGPIICLPATLPCILVIVFNFWTGINYDSYLAAASQRTRWKHLFGASLIGGMVGVPVSLKLLASVPEGGLIANNIFSIAFILNVGIAYAVMQYWVLSYTK